MDPGLCLSFCLHKVTILGLKSEGAITKLVKLSKKESQLVLTDLDQEYGPADRKTTLIQLASAALLSLSLSEVVSDDEEVEEVEEGAVGGSATGTVVREVTSTPQGKNGVDDIIGSERYIDDVAVRIELMKLEMEEREREKERAFKLRERKRVIRERKGERM